MKKALAVAMVAYIGTKSILATPMSRGEYCEYRGWNIPEGEDPNEPVYLVEYTDGGKPNDERHAGYITMSPKEVFDNAYRQNGSLNFGDAVLSLKQGKKVARSGWNGKGMWLVLVKPYTDAIHSVNTPCFSYRAFELPDGSNGPSQKSPKILPYIAMKTVGDELVPWLASQTDVLAEDWTILE